MRKRSIGETPGKNRNILGKVLPLAGAAVLALVVITVIMREKPAVEKGQIVLNMWDLPSLPTVNASSPDIRADRAVHAEFLRRHPDVKVVQTAGIQVYGPAKEASFFMAMAGGTAPDLFRINMRSMGSYIEQGFVRPLDDFLAEWPDAQTKIRPSIRPALSRSVMENGKEVTHTYAVPCYYDVMGFYYRKSLFQDAGLPTEGAPPEEWNWDTLWSYAKKLTFPEEGRFGLSLPSRDYGGWMWMNFVWQADGEIVRQYGVHPTTGEYIPLPPMGSPEPAWITADGTDLRNVRHVWRAVYDEPGGVEALAFYKKLAWQTWTRCTSPACRGKNICYDITPEMVKSGLAKCPTCGEETSVASLDSQKRRYRGVLYFEYGKEYDVFIQQKRIAMYMGTTGGVYVSQTAMDPDQIGLMPCPAGPRGTRANATNSLQWGINAQLKDPVKVRAAWEYIKWQASDEAEGIRVRTLVEGGQGRYVDPDLLRKHGFPELIKYVPETWNAAFMELKKYGRVEPYAPNYKNVQTAELAIPIDAAFFNEDSDPATVLRASATKVNDTIFEEIPLSVMRHRRNIGWMVAAGVGAALAFLLFMLGRSLTSMVAAASARRAIGLRFARASTIAAFGFMLPAVATVLVWQYVPLVRGAAMAFMDYRVVGDSTIVWLDNFIRLFNDPVFYYSLLRTAYYVGLALTFQFCAPIILALLLSEVPRGKIFYRVIYYLPAITSGLVIMFLWKSFYDPSTGLFNAILDAMGMKTQQWLQAGQWWLPMLCILMPMVWAGAGPGSLIYLAALKSVPEDIYEAADIDGASTLKKIMHITLPYLKPLIIINFIGAFIGAFQAMQQIFVMTGGGPSRATHVISLEIWYNAFMYLKFGYATAEAWILAMMLIGFTVYQLRILKRVKFTTVKV